LSLRQSNKTLITRSSYAEQETLPIPADFAGEPPLPADTFPTLARTSGRERLRLAVGCFVSDVAMLGAAVVVQLSSPAEGGRPSTPAWSLLFAGLVLAMFAARGAYAPRLRLRLLEDLRSVVSVVSIAAMAVITIRVLTGQDGRVAAETVHYWVLALLLVGAGRTAVLRSEGRARRRGETARPALIVGAGKMGRLTAKRLLEEPEIGLRPVGFVDPDPLDADAGEGVAGALPVLGDSSDLDRIVSEHGVQHVIVTFSRGSHEPLLALVRRCRELHVQVSILPRLFEVEGERISVERLGGLPLISLGGADPRGWQFKLKYGIERAVAGLALLVTLPLFAAATAGVKLTMGGPVFFRQRRVGADGREFDMLKLRTMKGRPEEDEEADIDWALEELVRNGGAAPDLGNLPAWPSISNDRRTRLGRMLRRFSLDELPQLWHVLRGEMSLIGPRPERVTYVRYFEQSIYRYADRHRVKSGITGWAQVNGLRGKTSLRDRVEWDNYYIENWTPWLDFKILLLTFACVLGGKHEEDWS
jgi:exopolysaccharide biosynthesis polyprenyl glycosylphosphotransferase